MCVCVFFIQTTVYEVVYPHQMCTDDDGGDDDGGKHTYGQYAFYDETNLKMGDSESFLFVHSQRFRIHSLYNLLTR